MLHRIETRVFPHLDDTVGYRTKHHIKASLNIDVENVRIVKVFTIEGIDEKEAQKILSEAALHDPVLQEASLSSIEASNVSWLLEVGFKPGVTDNEGRTARDTVALVLGKDKESINVYTSMQYRIYGDISKETITHIAKDLLANELIQRFEILSLEEWKKSGFSAKPAKVTGIASDEVNIVPLSEMSDEELIKFSQDNTLSLSLSEMHTVRNYFLRPDNIEQRKKVGLPANPTDAEIEVLAQTWSEHCKHKIFAAEIDYTDEKGNKQTIDSLYKTFILNSTKDIRAELGEKDFCRSVFKDNAGVVAFDENYDICIKVETHNSPSALDPYGGALTGIVGVNRDAMGTGLGGDLVCNTDVFCFASPFYEGELPPRLLHPRRVLEGVREGVEHGGNKSGVPTVNGSLVFDERFLGKPLVYCGTVGLIPHKINGKLGYEKQANVGDAIIMVGGRIGKDGIHGATFSSEELHQESPSTAVQIGDPITQRKAYDFILKARDLGLYSTITDNGAGGLSSSVGEMAEDTGGCKLNLALAPLKYDGLKPWEILLSEAQERMTLAVPQENLEEFLALAKHMDVEASYLGEYTDSGYFHITYNDKIVAYMEMDFMHKGLPQMQLKAKWKEVPTVKQDEIKIDDQAQMLKTMLGRLNICSKEYIIRQYDHEVKAGSVIKPLVGVMQDAPADAGVMRPVLSTDTGIVVSHGICPKFSDYDTYLMMQNAVDEAIRNAVAVGANPKRMAGVDNFCWCDPVQSEKTPDGEFKLAQLVRACQALDDSCRKFMVPCVSGKDSMKNDYTGGGRKISIPPTVLFSVLAIIDDVNLAVSSDFKEADEAIYVLGVTRNEMFGSELCSELNIKGAKAPIVEVEKAAKLYENVHAAMQKSLITSCHDLSDGGLVLAIAESCIGARLGADIELANVPCDEKLELAEIMYSESASRFIVTVKAENQNEFEKAMNGNVFAKIGKVVNSDTLNINYNNEKVLSEKVEALADSFKATLNW